MITNAPECEMKRENCMQEASSVSLELPIHQMFDDFMVFISKTEFE